MNKKLYDDYIVRQKEWFDNFIKDVLSKNWACLRIEKNTVTFGVIDENDKPIFGQDIEIRRSIDENNKFVCTTNIGSCGKSNIENGNVVGDRAFYYVGLGKLLSNSEAIETINYKLSRIDGVLSFIVTQVKEMDLSQK